MLDKDPDQGVLDKVGMDCGFESCERSSSHVLSTRPSHDGPFPDPSHWCLVWNILDPVNNAISHATLVVAVRPSVLAPVGSLKPCSPCRPHACAHPVLCCTSVNGICNSIPALLYVKSFLCCLSSIYAIRAD